MEEMDVMGDEIFWIDNVVPDHKYINGKWIKGFLAYGGNPPHISMDKTGNPTHVAQIREQGGFSADITGTKERQTWYMNVSRSQKAFTEATR